MSLFAREARAVGDYANYVVPLRTAATGTAGVPVTPATAISKVPLLMATNLVANMPDTLPLQVFRETGAKTQKLPIPRLLKDPEGQGYGMGDFGSKVMSSWILAGNVFVRVNATDSNNVPSLVTVCSPADVRVDTSSGSVEFVTHGGQRAKPFQGQPGGMIHRRAFPQPGQILGLSVVANFARTLGLSLASEQMAANFYADSAIPSAVITSDQPIDQGQADTILQRFMAKRGSREPTVFGAGLKYQPISIPPAEGQFLETQKFTAGELCRMVGPGIAEILGYGTDTSLTYANIESRFLHVLILAVNPWLVRFERMISDLFLPQPQYAQFDRDGFLQMTAADKWNNIKQKLDSGVHVINDIREGENEAPVDWGNEPFLPAIAPMVAAAIVRGEAMESVPIANPDDPTANPVVATPAPLKVVPPPAPAPPKKIKGATL